MSEEYTSPAFIALVDAVHHISSISDHGCYHPKWKPAECTLIARYLWDVGYRFTIKKEADELHRLGSRRER